VLAIFLTLGVVRGDDERSLLQPLVVRPVGRTMLLLARFLGAGAICVPYVLVVYFATMVLTGLEGSWWPDRIVVPGDGPAEDGEDCVADEFLARPAKPLDLRTHRRERRGDPLLHDLRIELRDHPHVIDEVGEEGGDDAPVAPTGEPRRSSPRRHGSGTRRNGRTALLAEACGRPDGGAARIAKQAGLAPVRDPQAAVNPRPPPV